MSAIDRLIEERIRAAVERGELSGLPGEGRPLRHEDLTLVREQMRMAIRVLKNAGMPPPAIGELKQLHQLAEVLLAEPSEEGRQRALAKFNALVWRLEAAGLAHVGNAALARYRSLLLDRLAGDDAARKAGVAPQAALRQPNPRAP